MWYREREEYDAIDRDPFSFVTKRKPKPDSLHFRPDHFALTEKDLQEFAEHDRRGKLSREQALYEQSEANFPNNRSQSIRSTMYPQSDFTYKNFSGQFGVHELPSSENPNKPSSLREPIYVDLTEFHSPNQGQPSNANFPSSNVQRSNVNRNNPFTNQCSNPINISSSVVRPSVNPNNFFASAQPSSYFQPNVAYNDQQGASNPQQMNINNPMPFAEASASNIKSSAMGNNPNDIRRQFLRRLKSILKFDGNSYRELIDFVDIAYEQMILQLRGEAKQVVTNLANSEWSVMKSKLYKHFSYLANKDVLTSQLENMRQEKDESLTKYAERARKLLQEKNSVYKVLTEDQKLEHNRLARKAFSKGITNNKLKKRLITRGASSLEDAIAYAIEAENDELYEIPNKEFYCRHCRHCRINGHCERECRSKNINGGGLNTLISDLQSFTTNRPFNRNNRNGPNRFNSNNNNNNNRFNQSWNS